ncbi:MAG TPA: hypothetical protein VEA40_00580 [Ramlibacter sp.]|nr:hypothetical protein [Ramlibacter sp.]
MVELRWAIAPNGQTRLQYRVAPPVISFGARSGWSDWVDVPHVMVPAAGVKEVPRG